MKKFLVFLSAIVIGNAYADTETIKWYVDDSVYSTTTCQSGGNVNLPTQPTKSGYTFVGWEVALYDFSTLDYTKNGSGGSFDSSKKNMDVNDAIWSGIRHSIMFCYAWNTRQNWHTRRNNKWWTILLVQGNRL